MTLVLLTEIAQFIDLLKEKIPGPGRLDWCSTFNSNGILKLEVTKDPRFKLGNIGLSVRHNFGGNLNGRSKDCARGRQIRSMIGPEHGRGRCPLSLSPPWPIFARWKSSSRPATRRCASPLRVPFLRAHDDNPRRPLPGGFDHPSTRRPAPMREAAESAETSHFKPKITAASGAAAAALQAGKIQNMVLKLSNKSE
ncbi:hypothetical protein C8R44DRAFT_859492 [Mycena epipterygia]|nr:hypothetical protein C8R44DRAFT_859492 [Mycena epipterygia]